MTTCLIPVSALIPTRNRSEPLARTLNSLAQQSCQPEEIIVVDGSEDEKTEWLCKLPISGLLANIRYFKATNIGAATQRNQAFERASQDVIWLMDDDILLEPDCLARLWNALNSNAQIGGVNAMITNQRYLPPGWISRTLFQILNGKSEDSYAGRCIGPAFNLLPEDDPNLPEIIPVEWLNSTCTLYRREALPDPLFPANFVGYSLMEDVTLSLTVGKKWKLTNARTARIFHDSQPGDHKSNPAVLAKMSLVNRHFVMTQLLNRRTVSDYLKLALLQAFDITASLQTVKGWIELPAVLTGKLSAVVEILIAKPSPEIAPEQSRAC